MSVASTAKLTVEGATDCNDWRQQTSGRADFACLASVGPLDEDLGSDLDDAVGWYAKVFGGIRRGAREPNEELLLPSWHI